MYTIVMSAILNIENYGITNIKEESQLNAEIDAGVTAVTLKNTQNVAATDWILIGNKGAERSEIRAIDSVPSSTSIVVGAATSFSHKRYDPVTILHGNQIKIYRAANVNGSQPADISFDVLDTVAIDSDNITTTYIDDEGGAGYWYKFTYKNQTTSIESDLGDSNAVRGSSSDLYTTVDEVREEAGMENNRWISDVYISGRLTHAMSTIDTYLGGTYTTPFEAPISPTISNIAMILAAGYVLNREYGTTTSGTSKDGQAKIDWAMEQLRMIRSGEIDLTDGSGNSLESGDRLTGWPDETTAATANEEGGGPRQFRITDEY